MAAWPFLVPVGSDDVAGYMDVITEGMGLSTMQNIAR